MRAPAPLHNELTAELRLRGFQGDLAPSFGDRIVSATDNSIYQVLPQLVVFPRNVDDLVRLARVATEPRFEEIVFAPRGGGTGTNGQSLTEGLVVDVSRHMNRIIEINRAERWVRVQAGVGIRGAVTGCLQHGCGERPRSGARRLVKAWRVADGDQLGLEHRYGVRG